MAELKPCPFCGGEAKLTIRAFSRRDVSCKVSCPRCQVYMVRIGNDADDSVEMAIFAWNERADNG
jgi:Lar family restriction alleviation protein